MVEKYMSVCPHTLCAWSIRKGSFTPDTKLIFKVRSSRSPSPPKQHSTYFFIHAIAQGLPRRISVAKGQGPPHRHYQSRNKNRCAQCAIHINATCACSAFIVFGIHKGNFVDFFFLFLMSLWTHRCKPAVGPERCYHKNKQSYSKNGRKSSTAICKVSLFSTRVVSDSLVLRRKTHPDIVCFICRLLRVYSIESCCRQC